MTLIEVLICMTLIAVLAGMLLPSMGGSRRSKTLGCFSNLRQIRLAYIMWASDNRDQFPIEISTNSGGTMEFDTGKDCYRHFKMLGPYIVRSASFVCPADRRSSASNLVSFGNSNLSYFVNLDAKYSLTNAFLFGDRYLTNSHPGRNGSIFIETNSLPGWNGGHDKYSFNEGNLMAVSGMSLRAKSEELKWRFYQTRAARAHLLLPE